MQQIYAASVPYILFGLIVLVAIFVSADRHVVARRAGS
jgi:hypothetical protein